MVYYSQEKGDDLPSRYTIKGELDMYKNVNDEKMYKELREKFNYYCEFFDTTCVNWWLMAFEDVSEFIRELAEIIRKYVEADDDVDILVECALKSICNYSRSIRNRMDEIELANYTREKFLNDLIDAAINGKKIMVKQGEKNMEKKVELLFERKDVIDYLTKQLDDEHVQFKRMTYNVKESEDGTEVVVTPGITLVYEVDSDYEIEFNKRLRKALDEMYLGV